MKYTELLAADATPNKFPYSGILAGSFWLQQINPGEYSQDCWCEIIDSGLKTETTLNWETDEFINADFEQYGGLDIAQMLLKSCFPGSLGNEDY